MAPILSSQNGAQNHARHVTVASIRVAAEALCKTQREVIWQNPTVTIYYFINAKRHFRIVGVKPRSSDETVFDALACRGAVVREHFTKGVSDGEPIQRHSRSIHSLRMIIR